jgi:hypothetical protein
VNPFRRPRPYITDPLPPADVIPRGMVIADTGESLLIEAQARLTHAAREVERMLQAEAARTPRNPALMNALLDLRSVLRPSAPGSEVLRESPPVPIGHAVPVIPGRQL